jgi:hypothetical protein
LVLNCGTGVLHATRVAAGEPTIAALLLALAQKRPLAALANRVHLFHECLWPVDLFPRATLSGSRQERVTC